MLTYYAVEKKKVYDVQHHGILGQKWGIRRYQNPDGTLTPEGKERYSKATDHEDRYKQAVYNGVVKQIKRFDLITEHDCQNMKNKSPKQKERIKSAAKLGLKALEKMNGYALYDHDKGITGNDMEWFIFEDQTIGCFTVADMVNRGIAKSIIKQLIKDANEVSDYKDAYYEPGIFQLSEGFRGDGNAYVDALYTEKNRQNYLQKRDEAYADIERYTKQMPSANRKVKNELQYLINSRKQEINEFEEALRKL